MMVDRVDSIIRKLRTTNKEGDIMTLMQQQERKTVI